MRLPQIAVVVMLAVAALQMAYFYPQLPAVVASHFNAAGAPNAWQPKGSFVGTICFIDLLFAALCLSLSQIIMSLPPELVNLPNKAYWLAPERRVATAHRIGDQFAWLCVAQIGFITAVCQMAINANLPGSSGRLAAAALWIAGTFVALLIVWLIRFVRTFARTSS